MYRSALFGGQPDVIVNEGSLNVVEEEYLRDFRQWRKTEPFSHAGLWTSGDKELDLRDLGYEFPKDSQDLRGGLPVFALVQSVDHDHGRDGGFPEWLYDQLIHLVV